MAVTPQKKDLPKKAKIVDTLKLVQAKAQAEVLVKTVRKRTVPKSTTTSLEKAVEKAVTKSTIQSVKKLPNLKKSSASVLTPKSLHTDQNESVKISNNSNLFKINTVTQAPRVPLKPILKLPIFTVSTLSTVARIAGVFFVASGAVLTLLNFPVLDGFGGQSAELITGTTDTSGTVITTDTTTTTNTSGSTATIDTTPDVRIAVEGVQQVDGRAQIVNVVPVMITVLDAGEVKLLAEFKSDGHIMPLGLAMRIDNTTWRFYWDTKMIPNGEYRLRTMVTNQYTKYDYIDSMSYFVANQILNPTTDTTSPSSSGTATTTVSTATTTTTTTTSTTNISQPTVSLQISASSPLKDTVDLKAVAHLPTEVKFYARNTNTLVTQYLGAGQYLTGDDWRLQWSTKSVPNGIYDITAKAKYGDQYVVSPAVRRGVENTVVVVATAVVQSTSTYSIATTSVTTTSETQPLQPTITTKLSKASPLAGFVEVISLTSPVISADVWALPKGSLSPYFLGPALKISATEWKYLWNTKQTPNGEYAIFTKVKTQYGLSEGPRVYARVLNELLVTLTPEQEASIDEISSVSETLIKVTNVETSVKETVLVEAPKDSYMPPPPVYIEPVESFMDVVNIEESSRVDVEAILNEFKNDLNLKLSELATALRVGDMQRVERIKSDIEDSKKQILIQIEAIEAGKQIIEEVNTYLSQFAFEMQELTIKNEKILKERLGDAVVKDSDKDDVSDYDEINLYHTNPFAADTDGDGYIDSVEIRLGYNPHDSKSESLVTYESPKEEGVARPDILVVESVTTLAEDMTNADAEDGVAAAPVRAVISGKGLPNSFVTLYVYSTPLVVTVKTDSEGGWSYIFDKELENGDHEVYVGITDNAGRIVAKSSPLPFVKTAEAFTDVNAALQGGAVSEPSLLKGNSMLMVGSIAVVALGLVLLLLGIHVSRKKDDPLGSFAP